MAASITLVPALLAMAGPRIDRLRIPGTNRPAADPGATPAARWSRAVQRRPWVAAVAGIAVLLVLAGPVSGLRLGFPDRGNDARDTTTRQAYDLVSRGFGAGANGPLLLVAPTSSQRDRDKVVALAGELRREPGVAAVGAPAVSPKGDAVVLSVVPRTSPQDPATEDLIDDLRDDVLPRAGVPVRVGGATAAFMDQSRATAARLPLFVGGVVVLAFLLLLVSFRSVVVAIKAGVMNLLSIGAAYGVVAYLAEGGWAGRLIGIDTATPVPPFIPVIMFAVFGAFALSPEVFLKLIGVGLATAILVDATVVRMVLVPAVMQLLGERNWWLPRWLDRLMPRSPSFAA